MGSAKRTHCGVEKRIRNPSERELVTEVLQQLSLLSHNFEPRWTLGEDKYSPVSVLRGDHLAESRWTRKQPSHLRSPLESGTPES